MFKRTLIPALIALSLSANAAALTGKGSFKKKAHSIKGKWALVEIQGQQVIAFTDRFKTADGPDLQIVLSRKSVYKLEKTPSFTDAVIITPLKSTKGEQHYVVPTSVDIGDFTSVLIYSQSANTLWGGFNIPAKNSDTDDKERIGDFFHDSTEDATSYGS